MGKRLKPGDVLEIEMPDGSKAFLLYAGKHRDSGDAVMVAADTFPGRPEDFSRIFDDAYLAFYPATAAVARGFASVVGRAEPPPFPPKRLRRAGARSGTRVDTWIIESDEGSVVKEKLTDEERRIPIEAIWNHEFLLDRVAGKWRPEHEG